MDNPLRLDKQLCFAIYAASRAMTQAYAEALSPLGLTYPQYLVLLVLWEHDDLSVKEIGDSLQLDSGTLTPLLKRLESSGLLTRSRDPNDERVVRINLSPEGKKLRRKALELPKTMACKTGMSVRDLESLRDSLVLLTQHVRDANASTE